MYNWIKLEHVPHSWVTALIQDLDLPINFIGLGTEDRRFVSPIKQVAYGHNCGTASYMHCHFPLSLTPCSFLLV